MPTYLYLTQVVHGAARARPGQPCLIFGTRRLSLHWHSWARRRDDRR
jgi:hypothetical protein